MDYLRKNKLIGWVVLVLIIMNAVTLTMLWIGKNANNRQGKRPGAKDLLISELNLTKEQIGEVEKLRKAHFSSMNQLRGEARESRRDMHELWQTDGSEDKVSSLAKRLGEIQETMELQTFDHFSKIRELLDQGQKSKFDKIIHDVLRRGDRKPQGIQPNGQNGQRGPRSGDRPPPRQGH